MCHSEIPVYRNIRNLIYMFASFELLNQTKLVGANIRGCNSPRKPRLLFNKENFEC